MIDSVPSSDVADPERFERTGVAADADRLGAAVRAAALGAVSREPIGVFDHVYEEPHTGLAEQRDHFARYLGGFAPADAEAGR